MRSSWRAVAPAMHHKLPSSATGLNIWVRSIKNTGVHVLPELPSNRDDQGIKSFLLSASLLEHFLGPDWVASQPSLAHSRHAGPWQPCWRRATQSSSKQSGSLHACNLPAGPQTYHNQSQKQGKKLLTSRCNLGYFGFLEANHISLGREDNMPN